MASCRPSAAPAQLAAQVNSSSSTSIGDTMAAAAVVVAAVAVQHQPGSGHVVVSACGVCGPLSVQAPPSPPQGPTSLTPSPNPPPPPSHLLSAAVGQAHIHRTKAGAILQQQQGQQVHGGDQG